MHIIAPEQGLTQPGMTIVCGDSHTSTHGAFGSLAIGIGTSEVEHVLATQTLRQAQPKTMSIEVTGELGAGVAAKDVILAIINRIGVDGGIGHVIEYRGDVIRKLSMDGRMTVCNMSIEAGARAGLVAPDETTFEYMQGRPYAPKGKDWDRALKRWKSLPTDEGATFDTEVVLRGEEIVPFVTWGTKPGAERPGGRRGAGPRVVRVAGEARSGGARARLHGSEGGHADQGNSHRPRLRRRLHQLAHRGSAHRGEGRRGPARRLGRAGDGRPRLGIDQAAGGRGGARPDIPRRRLRVAGRRLFHVPGDEPRRPAPWRTQRIDEQPQLPRADRGPADGLTW